MKKSIVGFAAAASCCFAFALCACDENEPVEAKKPEKLRDGEAISLVVGGTRKTDLAEYISIAGTGAEYTLTSSDEAVVTATLENTTATFTAVSRGTATVSASAGDVGVEFAVTVYGKEAVFEDGAITYDLRTSQSGSLVISPKAGSGEAEYTYEYTLKTSDEHASITGNTLTVDYDEPTTKTLTVGVSYTDGKLAGVAARTAEFDVRIGVTDSTPAAKAPTVEKEADAANIVGTYDIDLADNIINTENVPLEYTVCIDDGEAQTLDGSVLRLSVPETLPDGGREITVAVSVSYGSGADEKFDFVYKIKFVDVGMYRVENGGFDNGLEGWTATPSTVGAISEDSYFWTDLPMHNDGKYFKSGETGTLASSLFTVGGLCKISFKLGAGGKNGCYVTLQDEDGAVLRLWRNYKFEDTGGGDADKVGTEKFIENLVTYVADLSDLRGKRVRIVIHDDEEGTDGFAFINFDSLVTYYADESELPTADKQGGRDVFDAQDELADMTELKALLSVQNITERGDYTQSSYDEYVEKLAAARAVADNIASKQAAVDNALAELDSAIDGLAYRQPVEKDDADKNFKIFAGASRDIILSDYADTVDLSDITYEIASADDTYVIATKSESGVWTLAVPESVKGSHAVSVTLTVKHKGLNVLTVALKVTATSEITATLKDEDGIVKHYDLHDDKLTDKTKITLDFADNVDNPGAIALGYSVSVDGGATVKLDGSTYEFTFGKYGDTATVHTFNVTVEFSVDGEPHSISYDYVLNMLDTREYRIVNGSFDKADEQGNEGLLGWTRSNPDIGAVNAATEYWAERGKFNNDGKFFSAYTNIGENGVAIGGNETARGTLTSSPFKLGGKGWITYKLGGAKNADRVYLEIVDNETGAVLDRFYNNNWADDKDGNKTGCSMTAFKADLSAYLGKTVYIRITDNSSSDYGLFFADSFVTYYTAEPQDTEKASYVKAVSKKELIYSVANNGFESRNLDGWTIVKNCSIPVGDNDPKPININDCVIDRTSMWGERLPFNNKGFFLAGLDTGIPDSDTWTIRSSEFILGGSGWMSLRMGGRTATVKVYEANGTLLGEYRADHFRADDALFPFVGDGDQKVSYADMRTYFIDLHEHVGKKLYIELSDREMNDGWAGATFDEVVTYYETSPDTNGSDTVEAPVSKNEDGSCNYENVQLAWRVAVKHEENA